MEHTLQLTEITSKTKLEKITRTYIDDIVEGEVNPLQAVTVVAALEQFVKAVRGHVLVKDAVRAELEKYGSKTVKFNGATFQMKEVGVKYDYSTCNDPVWIRLKVCFDIAAAALKEREDMLKMMPVEGMTVVDELTGEVFQAVRPTKSGESGYSITIDK